MILEESYFSSQHSKWHMIQDQRHLFISVNLSATFIRKYGSFIRSRLKVFVITDLLSVTENLSVITDPQKNGSVNIYNTSPRGLYYKTLTDPQLQIRSYGSVKLSNELATDKFCAQQFLRSFSTNLTDPQLRIRSQSVATDPLKFYSTGPWSLYNKLFSP